MHVRGKKNYHASKHLSEDDKIIYKDLGKGNSYKVVMGKNGPDKEQIRKMWWRRCVLSVVGCIC